MNPITNEQPPQSRRSRRPTRTHRLARAAALCLALGVAALGTEASATHAAQVYCTSASSLAGRYDYTGGAQCFDVPAGVDRVTFDVYGAQGGDGGNANSHGGHGGLGGESKGTFAVHYGQVFAILVGQQGAGSDNNDSSSGTSCTNGGAGWDEIGGCGGDGYSLNGYAGGGGGGAGSDVRTVDYSGPVGGASTRLIVAGGGGGGGGHMKGDLDTAGTGGAGGGSAGSAGTGNSLVHLARQQGGAGGSASAGGTAAGGSVADGSAGSGGSGGGGGGGYVGGGAGQDAGGGTDGSAGGGGSGYVSPSATNVSLANGVHAGNGMVLVSISYATTTTLSVVPGVYGISGPTLRATVSPVPAGGVVQFHDVNGLGLGSCGDSGTPLVNGVATCAMNSTTGVYNFQIQATFTGYADPTTGRVVSPSASGTLAVAQQARTSATLAVSSSAPATGQALTLTANLSTVGAPGQTPLGTVQFAADGRVLGTAQPTSTGTFSSIANLTIPGLPVGTHSLTVSYLGDTLTAPVTSSAQALTVTASAWAACAAEGGTCSVSGAQAVAFGANGHYLYQTVGSGASVSCTNAAFGSDPAPGVVKSCVTTSLPPASNWTQCAGENGTCSFSGTMLVAFGANGAYKYQALSNGTPCTTSVFGDPLFGTAKACYAVALPS